MTEDVSAPERQFEPSKYQLGNAAQQLVDEFRRLVLERESRVRARRAADQARFERSISSLVLDLVHSHLVRPDGWLYVSMSKGDYSPSLRQTEFLTENFPDLVRLLHRVSLIELSAGHRGDFGTGRRTTIRAGGELKALAASCGVTLGDIGRAPELQGDPLVLRSQKVRGKAVNLPIPDSPTADSARAEMLQVNRWLLDAVVDWYPIGDEDKDPDTGDRFMTRNFVGSLEGCGRLNGGFWQRMRQQRRLRQLLINSEEPVELDYGQIGIRIAYSHAGAKPPPGDLYAVPGLEDSRGGVKQVLSALLARSGDARRFPKGVNANFPPRTTFQKVLDAVTRHHKGIAHLFGTEFYLIQQQVESSILLRCIHKMREQSLYGFPLHDCLLVAWSDAERTIEIMRSQARLVLGEDVPVGCVIADRHERLLPAWALSGEG